MTSVCPAGHDSTADDYCDVCGAPIDATAVLPAAASAPAPAAPASPAGRRLPPAGTGQACPNCGTAERRRRALLRELRVRLHHRQHAAAAGAAGAAAARPAGQPVPEDADLRPDRPPRRLQLGGGAVDRPGLVRGAGQPGSAALARTAEHDPAAQASVLVGRTSNSRNIHPDIDCGGDSGVSRRQSQLTTDGSRWFVEDLESANGTFIGAASGALPEDPIPVGTKRELDPDDRIYLGAWTRLVIREATEDEIASLG